MMTRRSVRSLASLVVLGVLPVSVAVVASACGSDEGEESRLGGSLSNGTAGSGTGGPGGGAGNGNGGTSGGEFGGGPLTPTFNNDRPLAEEEICQTMTAEAEPVPVDVYIMLDQSVSMAEPTMSGETRWEAVTGAINSFVSDARANGIGVGIDYFGIGSQEGPNCDPSNYSDPDVAIGELPGNRDAVVTSLNDAPGPTIASLTPLHAALQGALEYASAHAAELQAADSNRQTMVVLASDGFPSQCEEQSLPAISGLAAAAYAADPSVLTQVIALTDGSANARGIATAGGGNAFIISPDDADVAQSFLDALLSITTGEIPCDYEIDRGVSDAGATIEVDADRAEVSFVSATGTTTALVHHANELGCVDADGPGFYFDRPADPTRVMLCQDTCATLGAGRIDVKLTCVEDDPGTTF